MVLLTFRAGLCCLVHCRMTDSVSGLYLVHWEVLSYGCKLWLHISCGSNSKKVWFGCQLTFCQIHRLVWERLSLSLQYWIFLNVDLFHFSTFSQFHFMSFNSILLFSLWKLCASFVKLALENLVVFLLWLKKKDLFFFNSNL